MKSESTIFYKEFLEVVESFPLEEDQLNFLKLILNYGLGNEPKKIEPKFVPTFILVKATIDKAQEKYKSLLTARSEAGKKGMGKRWNKYTNEQEENFTKCIQIWNTCKDVVIVKKLTEERKIKLANLLVKFTTEDFEKAKEEINKSEFLRGNNNKMWFVTFDWLIEENNFIKVIEGNYTDRNGSENIEKIWNL